MGDRDGVDQIVKNAITPREKKKKKSGDELRHVQSPFCSLSLSLSRSLTSA